MREEQQEQREFKIKNPDAITLVEALDSIRRISIGASLGLLHKYTRADYRALVKQIRDNLESEDLSKKAQFIVDSGQDVEMVMMSIEVTHAVLAIYPRICEAMDTETLKSTFTDTEVAHIAYAIHLVFTSVMGAAVQLQDQVQDHSDPTENPDVRDAIENGSFYVGRHGNTA